MLGRLRARRHCTIANLVRAPLCVALVTMFAMCLPGAAATAASDALVVRDLPIDAEAKSAAEARELAIVKGQREAYQIMVQRIVAAADLSRVPALKDSQIVDLLEGFEIADERVAPTRYRANLTVTFQEERIRELLGGQGIAFARGAEKPIVVIPILVTEQGPMLWQDDNLWLQAWIARETPSGLVPIIVPLGDTADIEDLTAKQASRGDAAALSRFASRYGADEVAVIEARPKTASGKNGAPAVSLRVRRIRPGGSDGFDEQVRGKAGQPWEELFALAADRVVARLDQSWKEANTIRYDLPGAVRAIVPVANLGEWVKVRSALLEMPQVAEIEIIALARAGADIMLRFYGDQTQLEAALATRNLFLVAEPGGGYVLSPRRPTEPVVGMNWEPGAR